MAATTAPRGLTRCATVVALIGTLVLSACGGSGSQPNGTSSPQATASPTPTSATGAPATSAVATVAPPTGVPATVPPATPEPEGRLEKVREVVLAWSFAGSASISFQVIVELRNTGTGWAQVSGFDSDYTVLDAEGNVTTTESFLYEFPEFIPPGGTGYLIEDSIADGVTVADFATVEVDGRYDPVDEPGVLIEVSDIELHTETYSDGLTATGFVMATEDVPDAAVAVICLNAEGEPIGATWTNLVQGITAGEKKGFEALAETPPLQISDCKTVLGFAESTGL
jgi:hypothetical protein